MAEVILVMGKSGTGKSTSLRNLDPKETLIISPNAKSMPFPGSRTKYQEDVNLLKFNTLENIKETLASISNEAPYVKTIVIEDFTHFFSAHIFSKKFLNRNSGGEAFQRWNEFGSHVFQALFADSPNWRKDLTIVVIHHTEVKEDGTVGFKSSGKLLDNTIDFPSYFTWIFHSLIIDKPGGNEYVFQTNREAGRHAKSPMGAFNEMYIPNDLDAVLKRIHAYNMGEEAPQTAASN